LINTALGISQLISEWTTQYLTKNTINRDIFLLIFVLPNLFLGFDCIFAKSRTLYLINPFLDDKWLYSAGFILGIYTTNLTSLKKHTKFFCIAVILLFEANLQDYSIVAGILSFLRGMLVYTEQIHGS
jgi:hypothetical protein